MNAREYMQLFITGNGTQAIAELKRVGAVAKTELGAAEKSAGLMANRMMATGGVMVAAGAGIAMGLKSATSAYDVAGRETLKLSRLTGGAAEDMSRMRFVATQTGVGVDALATSVIRLSKSSTSNAGRSMFAELGIDLVDASGKTRDAASVLTDLAGVFEQMPDGIDKNALALKLFGRAGTDMIPMLNRGKEGIAALVSQADELGFTLNDGDLDEIKEYIKAQRELSSARQSLQMQIGREVFPALTDAMKTGADVAAAAVKGFQAIPAPVKSAGGAMAGYGAAALIAAGSTAIVAGATSRMLSQFRGAEGELTRTGKAVKGLSIALAAMALVEVGGDALNSMLGFDRTQTQEIDRAVASINDADAALNAFTRGTLAEAGKFSLMDGPKLLASQFNVLGQSLMSLPGAEHLQPFADVQATFDQLRTKSPEAAAAVLDGLESYTSGLDRNSREYRANTAFIEQNRGALADASAAERAATDTANASTAVRNSQVGTLRQVAAAYDDLGDAAEQTKSRESAAAEAFRAQVDPILAQADAHARLVEAKKKLAEVGDVNSKAVQQQARAVVQAERGVEQAVRGVEQAQRAVAESRQRVADATLNLRDAQRDLNEVLNDDPLFGMSQVPVEQQIADARNRLAEANKRLAANPADALGLTMRDDAMRDLEKAEQRQQDQLRNAKQRARDIEDARRRVSEAERGVGDANQGVTDSQRALEDARRGVGDARTALDESRQLLAEVQSQHGVQSEAYAAAARDVVRAALDAQDADAAMATVMRENGIDAVSKMNTALDDLAGRYGIGADATARLKTETQALAEQAERYAAALGGVASAAEAAAAAGGGAWGAGIPALSPNASSTYKPSTGAWAGGMPAMGPPKKNTVPGGTHGLWPNGFRPRSHAGSVVPGRGERDITVVGGQGVLNAAAMSILRPEGVHALNRGQVPQLPRLRHLPRSTAAAAPSPAAPSSSGGQGSTVIQIQGGITQVVPDPDRAGEAVVAKARELQHRAGRGLRTAPGSSS